MELCHAISSSQHFPQMYAQSQMYSRLLQAAPPINTSKLLWTCRYLVRHAYRAWHYADGSSIKFICRSVSSSLSHSQCYALR